jgi:predicted AAA+ superfamily ATPase
MEQEYLDRVVDRELDSSLASFGAVLIEGPKWCGKTWTAERRSASRIYLQDIRYREQYLETAKVAPDILLNGEAPRLIDEWQTIPILWDGVRFEVDQRRKKGQFILTGSAVPADNATMHTGTGRITRLLMRPMTLFESLESNGEVSLRSLLKGENIKGASSLTLERLAFALVRGGWPASVREEETIALRHAREYVKAIVNTDISRVDGVERNPVRVQKLMRSLARNISTPVKKKTILNDVIWAGGEDAISDKTFTAYVNALRRLFVIETQPAWSPALRSRTALRTASKCHFVDPSLAAALLRTSPQGLMQDFKTFGLLFESLCVRDLRVYAQAMNGEVSYYRDGSGLEADAIIHLSDGRWGAVEVKMGAGDIEKAAENLKKLKDKIDSEEMGVPAFLMVLTPLGFAYRREDGVYVVPIGCLRD